MSDDRVARPEARPAPYACPVTFVPAHEQTPPAGWYGDPSDPTAVRWWSGAGWTEYTAPRPPEPPARPARPPRPPRKWIGRFGGWIIVGCSAFIWLWLFGFSLLLGAIAPHAKDDAPAVLSPYLLVTGAATAAAAILYTMAYRLRPEDRLTPSRLVIIAGVGGLAATLVAGPINSIIDVLSGGTAAHPSGVALVCAGVVEELVKISAAVVLAWRLPVKDARIGLFVGGAVGLGFSVVENLGYLQEAFARGQENGMGFGVFLVTTIGRQLTGPFLHPVFSALLGAAVFGAARAGRFRLTWGVVLAYLAVAAAHGVFNGAAWLAQVLPWPEAVRGGLLLLFDLLFVVASGLTWWAIARRIRSSTEARRAAGELSA